ncbi:MAG: NUDIX domain-containing protein [Lachnospiraceae bacterium]|nr:NUDIX domain-containing protein [Lachnospiraceae bacterium]
MENKMKIRKSSRAIVLNKNNQIFLFQYKFDYLADNKVIWITPGGSLEEGESFEVALKRELFEELGVQLDRNCPEIYYRNSLYAMKNGEVIQSIEKFFLVSLEDEQFSYDHWTESEKQRMLEGKWWSLEEIRQSEEVFFTTDIIRILMELSNNKTPSGPQEIA